MLPRLVLIADGFTTPAWAERAVAAVVGGARWVHLRDHGAARDVEAAARMLTPRLWAADAQVSINTQLSLAKALGVGLHLGVRGPSVAAARSAFGSDGCLGFSAHDVQEGRQAVAAGADYLFFSPVFSTTSKPGHPGAGLAALQACCRAVPGTPVFALGGVTPERVAACLDAGAYGVAVLSGILYAPDPAAAVRVYQDALSSCASPAIRSLPT